MSKYMNRRAHQNNLSSIGGGIKNDHISDGLNLNNLTKRQSSEDGSIQKRVGIEELMDGAKNQQLKSKRPR